MTSHRTGTREEWRSARLQLLEAEKDLTRRSDALAQARQSLPWVRVNKDYRFDTEQGSATLKDLFRGRSQLLVYHFMFGPDYTQGCPSCSSIADGFAPVLSSIAQNLFLHIRAHCSVEHRRVPEVGRREPVEIGESRARE